MVTLNVGEKMYCEKDHGGFCELRGVPKKKVPGFSPNKMKFIDLKHDKVVWAYLFFLLVFTLSLVLMATVLPEPSVVPEPQLSEIMADYSELMEEREGGLFSGGFEEGRETTHD